MTDDFTYIWNMEKKINNQAVYLFFITKRDS